MELLQSQRTPTKSGRYLTAPATAARPPNRKLSDVWRQRLLSPLKLLIHAGVVQRRGPCFNVLEAMYTAEKFGVYVITPESVAIARPGGELDVSFERPAGVNSLYSYLCDNLNVHCSRTAHP
jgi:hypothetical protein